jgi:TolB protein
MKLSLFRNILKNGYLRLPSLLMALIMILLSDFVYAQQPKFTGQTNVGNVKIPGSVRYDSTKGIYIITGNGTNMWFNEDDFFYVWDKIEGDFQMTTDVTWVGESKQPHRKGGWVVRASLDRDAPYADAVMHGDSLICLQYRLAKGDSTKEFQSKWSGPAQLVFNKNGDNFALKIIKDGQEHLVGSVDVKMPKEVYAGLAVCSHDSTVAETAIFSHVELKKRGK